tara:strand:+ start:778 stop:960 length:183 start_codon:yes stop_codon:yes gene_type:complete
MKTITKTIRVTQMTMQEVKQYVRNILHENCLRKYDVGIVEDEDWVDYLEECTGEEIEIIY